MSRNLVIVRAGPSSLHPVWCQGANDFDIAVSYYSDVAKAAHLPFDNVIYRELAPGPKWPVLHRLLKSHPEWLAQYHNIWLPDDDLLTTADNISDMFSLFQASGLSVAQPALTEDSYVTWPVLVRNPDWLVRYTSFVEPMAPVFTRSSLSACLKTFDETQSGWGLDWVWPVLTGKGKPNAFGILDATPVKHTRDLGGDLYRLNPDMDPRQDTKSIVEKYKATVKPSAFNYGVNGGIKATSLPWSQRALQYLRRKLAERRDNDPY